MRIKLTDLNPSYAVSSDEKDKWLILDCPHCRLHPIAAQIEGTGKWVWKKEGSGFDDLSLSPSIASMPNATTQERERQFIFGSNANKDAIPRQCIFHFYIRNGFAELL
jgi:hypothetical protein